MKLGTKVVMILLFGLLSTLLVSSILADSGGQGESCQCTYSYPDKTVSGCGFFALLCSIMRNNGDNPIINAYDVPICTNRIIGPDCISCPMTTQSQLRIYPCSPEFVPEECKNEVELLLKELKHQTNITMNYCCPTVSNADNCLQLCAGKCDSCTVCAGATSETAVNRETSSTRTNNPQKLTGNETTTIIGAVVGSVLGAILILLLILLICCLLKRRSTRKETDEYQGCTVDQRDALPPAFSFDNPEYSQPPSGDSKKYEQLNPITIEKNTNNYESLNRGGEYDNDIPSIVKSVDDAKSYDNVINKKDDMDKPTNNASSAGNVHTDSMGNNSMTGEADNKSDPPVGGNDDTTLIDNSLYGSDKPAAATIQGNDDTILVDNTLYGSG